MCNPLCYTCTCITAAFQSIDISVYAPDFRHSCQAMSGHRVHGVISVWYQGHIPRPSHPSVVACVSTASDMLGYETIAWVGTAWRPFLQILLIFHTATRAMPGYHVRCTGCVPNCVLGSWCKKGPIEVQNVLTPKKWCLYPAPLCYCMLWQSIAGVASYPGLLTPVFVACISTASDKCWGEKSWVWGYIWSGNSLEWG